MMSSKDDWFIAVDGKPQGPFTFEQLAHEASAGRLRRSALVWSQSIPNWKPAEDLADLFPAAQPAPFQPVEQYLPPPIPAAGPPPSDPVDQNPAPPKPSSRSNWISKPTTTENALEAVRRGAAYGYVFAGMYVLGGLLSYAMGYDINTQGKLSADDALYTLLGFLAVATVIVALSYWFQTKRNILVPVALGLWFAGEILFKLANQSHLNAGWLIFYAFIAVGFISGLRGALFLRKVKQQAEALSAELAA